MSNYKYFSKKAHEAGLTSEQADDIYYFIMPHCKGDDNLKNKTLDILGSIFKIAEDKQISFSAARALIVQKNNMLLLVEINRKEEATENTPTQMPSNVGENSQNKKESENVTCIFTSNRNLSDIPEELRPIADSLWATIDAEGKRPPAHSGKPFGYGAAEKLSPAGALARIAKFHRNNRDPRYQFATMVEFADHFKIGKKLNDGRPSSLSLNYIFNLVSRHIEQGESITLLSDPQFVIGGSKVASINSNFRENAYPDLYRYISPDSPQPETLRQFAEMAILQEPEKHYG